MKHSVRTRFTLGMIFLFMIILVLSVSSDYYLNRLSGKTDMILKENYLSVVYARDMSEGITEINQEITTAFLTHSIPDNLKIKKETDLIGRSLKEEKNNITEPGEDKLVSGIDGDYTLYLDSVLKTAASAITAGTMINLQNRSASLYQKLLQLSRMNGNAIEMKTDDAKTYSKRALTKMTILASLCFIVGMSFTISFSTYFNQRFFQLYNGLKELVASNFTRNIYYSEQDEFYEISQVLNEMADKLKNNKQKLSVTLQDNKIQTVSSGDLEDLKSMLFKMKITEERAAELISRIENRIK